MRFHYTIARDGRWPLFGTLGEVHRTMHVIARCGGSSLLLFGLADDHLHLVMDGSRTDTGHRIASLQQTLRKSYQRSHEGKCTTQPARAKPVTERNHMEWLLKYVIRQLQHHRARFPAPDWQASCFPDLVGARLLPGFDRSAIHRALPRLSDHEVWDAVGLPVLEPVQDEEFGDFSPASLISAAAAVHAAPPELRGQGSEVLAARPLALALLRRSGLPAAKAGAAVGCSHRTALRHLARGVDPAAMHAARLQLAIMAARRARPGAPNAPVTKPSR